MTDEELDRLFRKAAENYEQAEAPAGAWGTFLSRNEKKLSRINTSDETLPGKNKLQAGKVLRQYWQIAAAIVIAITGTAGWLLLYRKNKVMNMPSEIAVNKIIKKEEIAGRIKAADSGQHNTTTGIGRIKAAAAANDNNELLAGRREQEQPSFIVKNSLAKENRSLPIALDETQGMKLLHPPLPEIELTDQAVMTKPNNLILNNGKAAYEANNYAYSNLMAIVNNRKKPAGNKWQIGIVGGTNVAMVKGDVSGTPGLNTGITVQRRINNSRVSVESGIIYENMIYAVETQYFNPGGKPVSSKVSNISGSCTMVDVPVNVRYDMVNSRKRKAYVSTGVSSTLMVKQSYVYDYTDENGTRSVDRDVTGLGKSLYAVANVSVGYEQKWNRTSVQVAPYLKIPMGEIGYGNLSLGGLGTQVSIKRDL